VIFAGTAITFPKSLEFAFIASTLFGLAGIVLTVCWFTLESNWKIKRGKPGFLLTASIAFGCQVGTLIAALLLAAS